MRENRISEGEKDSCWKKQKPNSITSTPAWTGCGGDFDFDRLKAQLQAVEEQTAGGELWSDPEKAKGVLRERSRLQKIVERWERLKEDSDHLRELVDLMESEGETALLEEVDQQLSPLMESVTRFEIETLLHEENDHCDAIMMIHSGAGGTESQDWAQMLARMYVRWAERHGCRPQVLYWQPGEEAGIKSATLTVSGENAYGYLKAEIGVHRLVRISPFDANHRRHTSFASVFVYPDVEDEIKIDVNEADLRIDTFRSSGAGGQHVNVTDSAVRITHLPTGIVVQSQNERSQHKNRSFALKVLKARLYELEKQKRQEKREEINSGKKEIGFGSQIRSYTLHPYRLVKDHRTQVEVGNVDAVLDGALDLFIEAYLLSRQYPATDVSL